MQRLASVCRTSGLALLAGLAFLPLLAALRPEFIALHLKATIIAVFALTVWEPAYGLLALAAIAPLGRLFTPGVAAPLLRLSEAVVLAFLSGWLIDLAVRRVRSRRAFPIPLAVFSTVVLASTVVQLAILQLKTDRPWPFFGQVWNFVSGSYVLPRANFPVIAAAALLLEGIGLAAAARLLCRSDQHLARRLLLVTALAGLGIAILDLGFFGIKAFSGELPQPLRISVHVLDLNATGSYFAMIVPMVYAIGRARSRAAACVGSGILLAAAWISGSRAGVTAAIVAIVVPWAITRFRGSGDGVRGGVMAGAAALMALILAAAIGLTIREAGVSDALRIRLEFLQTSLRMLDARPAFGIGLGEYFRASGSYMPQRLLEDYRFENAHNNFLQIGAELGLAGLVAFLWLIGSLLSGWRRAWRPDSENSGARSMMIGLAAFLATCLLGHPLLVHEVSYPFWIVLGAAAGIAQTDHDGQRAKGKGQVLLAAAAMALILASIPYRVASEVRTIDLSGVSYGLGNPEKDTRADRPFRRTTGTATLFVRSDARAVDLPVRLLNVSPEASADVRLALDGRPANQKKIDDEWTTIGVRFPSNPPDRPFRWLDLDVICAPSACPENGLGALAVGDLQVR